MATKSPLALVKERFSEKSKLVEAVQALATDELWTERVSKDRGGSRQLRHVSNAKLLRLHATFTEVKEKFGTRTQLIDEILKAEHRLSDQGYKKRLETYPVPRLYDLYKSGLKRAKAASKPAQQEQT